VKESKEADQLVAEFEGIFSRETVLECLRDTTKRFVRAPVQMYVGLLSERFAREALRAAALAA